MSNKALIQKRRGVMTVSQQKRPLVELKLRAKPVIDNPKLVMIARLAVSPSAAYNLALINTGDQELAQACRWLAMIKRDHGETIFDETVQEQ